MATTRTADELVAMFTDGGARLQPWRPNSSGMTITAKQAAWLFSVSLREGRCRKEHGYYHAAGSNAIGSWHATERKGGSAIIEVY